MQEDPGSQPPDLSGVRIRRARLRRAGEQLEASLAAPLPGRAHLWSVDVGAALDQLVLAWARHVALNESRDGLFDQIAADAPRLLPGVARLRHEHETIASALAAARQRLGAEQDTPEHLRESLTGLLGSIVRHRQRGSDLVYQAYHIDIGGE